MGLRLGMKNNQSDPPTILPTLNEYIHAQTSLFEVYFLRFLKTKIPGNLLFLGIFVGTPDAIRTHDLQSRR